jgi:hypothetical protein
MRGNERSDGSAKRNELFQPRRMAYVFNLDAEDAAPTALMRSKHECPPVEPRQVLHRDAQLAAQLQHSLSLLSNRSAKSVRKQKRRERLQREAERTETQRRRREEAASGDLHLRSQATDDDIFADVGTDFVSSASAGVSERERRASQAQATQSAGSAHQSLSGPSASYFGEKSGGEAAQPPPKARAALSRSGVTSEMQNASGAAEHHAEGRGKDEGELREDEREDDEEHADRAKTPPDASEPSATDKEEAAATGAIGREPNLPDNIFTRGADEPWKRRSGKKPTELLKEGKPLDDDGSGYFEMDDAVQAADETDEPLTQGEKQKEKEKKKDEIDPERKMKSQLMKIQSKFQKEHGEKHQEAFMRGRKRAEKSKGKAEGVQVPSTPKYDPGSTPSRKRKRLLVE